MNVQVTHTPLWFNGHYYDIGDTFTVDQADYDSLSSYVDVIDEPKTETKKTAKKKD